LPSRTPLSGGINTSIPRWTIAGDPVALDLTGVPVAAIGNDHLGRLGDAMTSQMLKGAVERWRQMSEVG
jgi:hypothetical protein